MKQVHLYTCTQAGANSELHVYIHKSMYHVALCMLAQPSEPIGCCFVSHITYICTYGVDGIEERVWPIQRQHFERRDWDRAGLGGYTTSESCDGPRPNVVLSAHCNVVVCVSGVIYTPTMYGTVIGGTCTCVLGLKRTSKFLQVRHRRLNTAIEPC